MRRHWLGFILLLLALAACSGGTTNENPEEIIEMSLRTPGQSEVQAQALTTTTSALQVLGLINPPGVKITYSVNGGSANPVSVIDGAFTFLATLQAGKNKIAVTASLTFNPKISLTKTLEVTYNPTVPGGLTYDGTLDDKSPVFARPDTGSGISEQGRTNPYNAYTFNIGSKDWYAISSAQLFDGYLLLYKNSFDPKNPAENLIAQNDDFGSFDPDAEIPGTSRIRAELEPGQYVIVTTACGDPKEGCGPNRGQFSNLLSRTDPPPPPFQLPAPDDSKFNITVRFLTNNVTAEQQQAFVDAANRWAEVITADISNIVLLQPFEPNPDSAAIIGTIDDLIIDASFIEIDGPNGILGQAGAQLLRPDGPNTPLPAYGIMEFDIAEFEPGGVFEDPSIYNTTILHEMGHVLGIASGFWSLTNKVEDFNPNPPLDVPPGIFNPNYDPRFIGEGAKAEYAKFLQKAGKTDKASVPIENTSVRGTINGHWRELTFDNELMTGFIAPNAPLSTLTAASLGDLGYTVDLASTAIDDYALPVQPSFAQLTPNTVDYVFATEFLLFLNSTGSIEAGIQGVDLKLDQTANPNDANSNHPINSTSACEAEDFANFVTGKIALIQRGGCVFTVKVANAQTAGASGVIIFNQGDDSTNARSGLFRAPAGLGLIGVSVPFELGVELATTEELTVKIDSLQEESLLTATAVKPQQLQEIILLPVGTISANGKLGSLPE